MICRKMSSLSFNLGIEMIVYVYIYIVSNMTTQYVYFCSNMHLIDNVVTYMITCLSENTTIITCSMLFTVFLLVHV